MEERCPNCDRTISNMDNNLKGETFRHADSIDTYTHNKLRMEYCSECGYIFHMEVDNK